MLRVATHLGAHKMQRHVHTQSCAASLGGSRSRDIALRWPVRMRRRRLVVDATRWEHLMDPPAKSGLLIRNMFKVEATHGSAQVMPMVPEEIELWAGSALMAKRNRSISAARQLN